MKEFFKKIGRVIVRFAILSYCKIVYKLEIIGAEKIPADGPLIYCGNHRTYLDPPLIVVTAKRHVRFMAKEELRKNPFFAFLGVIFDAIYVKRDSKDVSSLKEALKTLKKGGCIALFPEGTRNGLEKGEKVKGGAAFMAVRTGAKVVPVGISGESKPFHKVTIKYGEPLDFSEYKGNKQDKEELDNITNKIMDNIIKLAL